MIVRICILNNSRLTVATSCQKQLIAGTINHPSIAPTTIMYDVDGEIASEVYWIQENSKGFGLFVSG
jgi:hypothetical protein